MNSIIEFFVEDTERSRGFRMGPAIVMALLFLAFLCATAYVLVSSF